MNLALNLHLHHVLVHTGGSGLEHSIVPMMKVQDLTLVVTLIFTRTSFHSARDCPHANYPFCDLSVNRKKSPWHILDHPSLSPQSHEGLFTNVKEKVSS